MATKVKVNLPRNVSDDDLKLFQPFLSYKIEKLIALNLKNVFVTHSGLCTDNGRLIKESHHDYQKQLENFQNEADYFHSDVKTYPENLIKLEDENIYLLIHHPWFGNYYHWICEGLPRIWLIKNKAPNMILILPEICKNVRFILETIKPFEFKNIFFVPSFKSLHIQNLCMPQVKPICDAYDSIIVNEIRQFYLRYAFDNNKLKINLGERIYLSRRKSSKRKISNEWEVEELIQKYGFNIICNEDYDFWEQLSIYSNSKYLVSIHGAGLTNMIFMKDDSRILEMHKKQTNSNDWHSLAFWYLSDAVGFAYYHQVCAPINEDDHFLQANLHVDLKLLDQNLSLMCS